MAIHFDSLRTGLGQAVAAYGIQPVSGKIKRLDPTGDGSKRAVSRPSSGPWFAGGILYKSNCLDRVL